MLRIDQDRRLLRLEPKQLSELRLLERSDIQRMICESADAFFAEMGEPLKLIGEEIKPSDFVQDRVDLLAIANDGTAVVIELKRGNNKLHLLQALAYAGMIAKWEPKRFSEELAKTTNQVDPEKVAEDLENFLEGDTDNINVKQRVILIAEEFDWEVLVAAEWLHDTYGVDIRCYRITAGADGTAILLTCICIFPPPELTKLAIQRGPISRPAKWTDWEAALRQIENEGIREFYLEEVGKGQPNNLQRRRLRYSIQRRYLFSLIATRKSVYVWQRARFPGDQQFWIDKLGEGCKAEPVKEKTALRFYLYTESDCVRFKNAVDTDLQSVPFGGVSLGEGSDEDEPAEPENAPAC